MLKPRKALKAFLHEGLRPGAEAKTILRCAPDWTIRVQVCVPRNGVRGPRPCGPRWSVSGTVVRSDVAPGDPLGSFQSFGKNLAPQGETSPSRRRAAKKFNDKFQFIGHTNQPKG